MAHRQSLKQIGGRIGGYRLRAKHDPRDYTRAGRAAFAKRFYDGIPEDLPAEERDRRARAALRAHMLELSLKSARARRSRRAAR